MRNGGKETEEEGGDETPCRYLCMCFEVNSRKAKCEKCGGCAMRKRDRWDISV